MSDDKCQPLRRSTRVRNIPNYCELDSGEDTDSNPEGYRQLTLMDCPGTIKVPAPLPSQRQTSSEATSEEERPVKQPSPPRKKRFITLEHYGMKFEVKERPKVEKITKRLKQVTLTAILETVM